MKKIRFDSIIITILFVIGMCLSTAILIGIFYLTVINKLDCSYDEGELKARIDYLENKNNMLVEFCKIKSSDDQIYYSQRLKKQLKTKVKLLLDRLRHRMKE